LRYTALTASLASQLLQKAYSVRTTDQRKTKYRWQAERREVKTDLDPVGAGLLAIASPRSRRYTALTASLASQLLQKAYSVRTTDQRKYHVSPASRTPRT
uniref:hypothetical protein n=1 Tax=Pseudomonas sp. GL-RE-29 TaxID=2832375 RepID=UPI001CBFB682